VHIAEAERRIDEYPHQLSGGMRQRVMIAMALACNPAVLIADEPTTALDVTIQAQILNLMLELKKRLGTAIILITHDLGVVAETAQRVVVMYAGRKVEQASVEQLFERPLHPYTRGLLRSIPSANKPTAGDAHTELHEIAGVVPTLLEPVTGCAFADRCELAQERCRREYPPFEQKRDGHFAACWRIIESSGQDRLMSDSPVVLNVENLTKHFPVRSGFLGRTVAQVRAVDGVSLHIRQGETLGLVGESGSGKSTVGKAVLRLLDPTAGRIHLHGEDITQISGEALRDARRKMQMIFQDPYASLNPRLTIGDIIMEPLENFEKLSAAQRRGRAGDLLDRVGLRREALKRYPHEFSGGQRQRVGVARALALNPSLIVADEPVSALDVSVQAQVLNLLVRLQREFNLAYLFISHDLGVVEHISHRVAVMYLGQLVEVADKERLFANAQHPYTEALLSAVPIPDPTRKRKRIILPGDVPSPINPPSGCRFHTRCPYAEARCKVEIPVMRDLSSGHSVACHLR
jgi:peptide/nickel transport system ATP-binding protein